MPTKKELGPEYYHEACDRTFCIQLMIDDMLRKHPVFTRNKELMDKLDKADEILGEIYQETGAKM